MAATAEQLAVINHRGGHILSASVPGSGKSYTMVHRCLSLLKEGVSPERLLVMMFNVSAREDFTHRLQREAQAQRLPMPEIQTFHAFGRKLCLAMEKRGLLPQYKLEERGWVFTRMAKAALILANESLSGDEKIEVEHSNIETLMELVEHVKNEFCEISKDSLPDIKEGYLFAIKNFEELRHEARLRSFTDLIYDPAVRINADDHVKHWVGNRYEHIIGDEAQDMNQLQTLLMGWIAGRRAHICIVGDEDQSVYAWRGGRPEYMVHLFEKQFPNCARLPLTSTFRYGHQVALMANHVIAKNQLRSEKLCMPGTDRKTNVVTYKSGKVQDGQYVAQAVQKWQASGRKLSETVVLVREYSHTVSIEAALLNQNLAYKIVGAPPFFERKEAQSIRGLVSLVSNGFASNLDPEARKMTIQALLTVPTSFLKAEIVEQLASRHYVNAKSFLFALNELLSSKEINQSSKKLLTRKIEAIECAIQTGVHGKASDFLQAYIDTLDLKEALLKESAKPESAIAKFYTINQIVELADTYKVPTQEMLSFLDGLKVRYEEMANSDAILITSAHRSKGLEWPHVIIPFLSEGTFPAYDRDEGISDEELESERRLYFVAITRAVELLSLIHPADQLLDTKSAAGVHILPEFTQFSASRFLYESNIQLSRIITELLDKGMDKAKFDLMLSQMDSNQNTVAKAYLSRHFT